MSDEFEDGNESEGIKNLRKQFDQQSKELKELREYREAQERQKRQQTLGEVFKTKGLNPKAAKFYNEDDTSDEAISKWLEENGDVFGLKPNNEQSQEEANAERIIDNSYGIPAAVDNGLSSVPLGDIEKRREMLRTLPLEECQRLGLLPKL